MSHRKPQVCVLGSAEPGSAAYELAAQAGDACIVIGGRAGTKSEMYLAWLHRRPLLPLPRESDQRCGMSFAP
ncbi:MAG: hypothetical protein RIQ60_348 [Pseudomonadota bacterium]